MTKKCLILSIFVLFCSQNVLRGQTKLGVLIVIDQLPADKFAKAVPHFRYGLKHLMNYSHQFTQAEHPHARPATATGHASLGTGTIAADHGIVDNNWFDLDGKSIQCTDASDGPNSPGNIMCQTLADRITEAGGKVFSISFKDRASIGLAGKSGKAFWFDYNDGGFISGDKYYKKNPSWLKRFNKNRFAPMTSYTWQRANNPASYQFDLVNDYSASAFKHSLIGKTFQIDRNKKKAFTFLRHTPFMSQSTLNCSLACLAAEFNPQRDQKFLLCCSLSSPDYIGHASGPDSADYYDMLYHIDRQLSLFLRRIRRRYRNVELLVAVTSDHGAMSMPEILFKRGSKNSRRIMTTDCINQMNLVGQKHGIQKLVYGFVSPRFYVDERALAKLSSNVQQSVNQELKQIILNTGAIEKVWLRSELEQSNPAQDSIEHMFKQQLYPGRSGYLICKMKKFMQLTNYHTGTSHCTPYIYDRHVPLMLYSPGKIARKITKTRVWVPQLTQTLANFFGVAAPSSARYEALPA